MTIRVDAMTADLRNAEASSLETIHSDLSICDREPITRLERGAASAIDNANVETMVTPG
jgi:hypothetical protein